MSMYSTTHQVATPVNGIGGMNDGSGTINPAALNSSGAFFGPLITLCPLVSAGLFLLNEFHHRNRLSIGATDHIHVAVVLSQAPTAPSPRGVKRSRSPDQLEESWAGADDDGMSDFPRHVFAGFYEGSIYPPLGGEEGEKKIHSSFSFVAWSGCLQY
jgi:hypothetical protein